MKKFIKKYEKNLVLALAFLIFIICLIIFLIKQNKNEEFNVKNYQPTLYNQNVITSVTLGSENANSNEVNVAISKEQAVQIAEEEVKNDRYKTASNGNAVYSATTKNSNEEKQLNVDLTNKINSYRWTESLEYKDDNGNGLFQGQQMWCVRLIDTEGQADGIYIYVDAQTGKVVGAGMNE